MKNLKNTDIKPSISPHPVQFLRRSAACADAAMSEQRMRIEFAWGVLNLKLCKPPITPAKMNDCVHERQGVEAKRFWSS